MRVLVVGSGAREHALAWKLHSSPLVSDLFCAPGNPGTAELATNVEIPTTGVALALWAVENQIDFTIVGPEEPLAHGIVDVFQERGLRIFGPSKEASLLEGSKAFAKSVMLRAGVRTPRGEVFSDYTAARAYVEAHGAPIVIKADGLAAGKGVVVAETLDEALAALDSFLIQKRFGAASAQVVIEERIPGQEASLIALVDGEHVLPLVPSQDFKRLRTGDEGPNTGGMGAISPTSVLSAQRLENLVAEIFIPVLTELHSRGIHYRGFLYAGVMVEPTGAVSVLEFNCRLGDPETQVLMLRMKSDLLPILLAATNGALNTVDITWRDEAAACVVIAAPGYPEAPQAGIPVSGIFPEQTDRIVFQAGTKRTEGGDLVTSGGRVLTVAALGETANIAAQLAYEGVSHIQLEGMHFRSDIRDRGL